MNLSNDLISQFVKATKSNRKTNNESTVLGTTVIYDGKTYVKLDGSDLLTPVTTTTDVKSDERVTVMIKDHTATITGNISSPAARTDDVQDIGNRITEAEILIADKVSTKELDAESARIDTLVSDNVWIKEKLTATEAEIDTLVADNVTINESLNAQEAFIKKLETEKLSADAADIKFATIESLEVLEGDFHDLEATYGEFQELTTTNFDAVNAEIRKLDTTKLSAEQADLVYANIDFSNIGEAAIDTFYAKSGIIQKVTISEGVVVKELVGVTIKGDLIEGGTVKADRLVVKGSDGLYYKLNVEAGATTSAEVTEEKLQSGLHGTTIIAHTITAEKITVDDLVAFDATIGGFKITEDAIYSGAKSSAVNTTRGIYLDNEGQAAFGDATNFIKYYKDQNGAYKLEISADSILLGSSKKNIEDMLGADIEIGARNLIRNSTNLIFADYHFTSTYITVEYDDDGNVTVTSSAFDTTYDENGNVNIGSHVTAANDDEGNVILNGGI